MCNGYPCVKTLKQLFTNDGRTFKERLACYNLQWKKTFENAKQNLPEAVEQLKTNPAFKIWAGLASLIIPFNLSKYINKDIDSLDEYETTTYKSLNQKSKPKVVFYDAKQKVLFY